MHGARATTVDSGIAKGSWSEIFRNGLGLYSALVIGGGRQRLRTGGRQEARKGPTSPSQRFPRPECEPEKVERLVRKVAQTVRILAVDDLRLLGMQHQLAGRKAFPQRAP